MFFADLNAKKKKFLYHTVLMSHFWYHYCGISHMTKLQYFFAPNEALLYTPLCHVSPMFYMTISEYHHTMCI